MLLLEEMLAILFAGGIGIFMIGIPGYKLYRAAFPPKRNALKEAQERLEQARLEAEAAKLNKETEKVYEDLYHDVLEDEPSEDENSKHRRL
jgi:hypothetical protein